MPLGKLEHVGLYALSLLGAACFGLWQGSVASGIWMHTFFVFAHLHLALFAGIRVVLREGDGVDTHD